jgi:hypothetical protein
MPRQINPSFSNGPWRLYPARLASTAQPTEIGRLIVLVVTGTWQRER